LKNRCAQVRLRPIFLSVRKHIMSTAPNGLLKSLPTFVDILRWRAAEQPDRRAYIFLADGETEGGYLTYGELDRQARAIAGWLQSHNAKGERALLLYPPGLDFIAAFFGCLYAGVIAVPTYPPQRNRPMPRIQSILADAKPIVALRTTEILADLEPRLAQTPELADLRRQATDKLSHELSDEWRDTGITGDQLAFLQYTSGSTAAPKGVMVSHGNLLANSAFINHLGESTAESVGGTWLPSFHDMGLIEGVLQPLYAGYPCYFMSPVAFLQRPIRWLQMITRYKVTHSGGPNFAFDLCARKITPEQRATLDLSSWYGCYNGAEPIRRQTIEQFFETFQSCGLSRQAIRPVYGLAESTLLVSGNQREDEAVFLNVNSAALEKNRVAPAAGEDPGARALVASGRVNENHVRVVIVNPETLRRCAPDEIGEIWLQGPSVTQGYWNRPEETAASFHAIIVDTNEGPFFRTGDLGFLRENNLFVTGRLKDLIIIAGRNHYPQDIELTAERSHPALQAGGGAAFSIDDDGVERLIVVHEVKREALRKLDMDEVVSAVRQAVAREHELRVAEVYLIKPGAMPKTSSGKIQRRLCRARLLAGELELVKNGSEEKMPV